MRTKRPTGSGALEYQCSAATQSTTKSTVNAIASAVIASRTRSSDRTRDDGHESAWNQYQSVGALSATGVTAGHLIRQRVLTEAKRALVFTNQPIHEIAYDLAFYTEQGLIKGAIRLDDVVDSSFVDAVVKELGPYRP